MLVNAVPKHRPLLVIAGEPIRYHRCFFDITPGYTPEDFLQRDRYWRETFYQSNSLRITTLHLQFHWTEWMKEAQRYRPAIEQNVPWPLRPRMMERYWEVTGSVFITTVNRRTGDPATRKYVIVSSAREYSPRAYRADAFYLTEYMNQWVPKWEW